VRNILKTLLLCFFCSAFAYSQTGPDYKERNLLKSKDSLSAASFSIIPAFEGAVDAEEYKIGPGDKFLISINGLDENQFFATVNPEGVLYLPRTGSVDVNNESLKNAKLKIEKLIRKYYKSVDIFVSLAEFRKIKVTLVGDVKASSTMVVTSNSRLVDLINISAGLSQTANLRHIKITSSSGNVRYYDLLSFLRNGENRNNPFLNAGDVVSIEKSDVTVAIYGRVKYPGSYEFIEGETVAGLLALAGGVYENAVTDSIEIIRFDKDNKTQKSLYCSFSELKQNNLTLAKYDKIVVREKPDYMLDRVVQVNGLVKYPGLYKIVENKTTLKEVLNQTGGFRENASLKDATLSRKEGSTETDPEFDRLKNIPRNEMTDDEYDYLKSKSRQRKGLVITNVEELILKNDESENVVLKNGDVINVPEVKNYVIMLGQVVNPGNIVYEKGLNYKDYIKIAGGYGWRASKGDVRIIKANTGEWVDADESIAIKPGDTIWIPEDPPGPKFWTVFNQTLTIVGQVATVIAATVAVIVATR